MLIEFAGPPRTGKSTSISTARDYFSRKGRTVEVIGEASRLCPFGNENRIALANWTANYALRAVLEAKFDEIDPDSNTNPAKGITSNISTNLILQDRGLFDALAFFRLLYKEDGRITLNQLALFEGYFADVLWTQRVDLVLLFEADPKVSLARDLAIWADQEIHHERMRGVITNEGTLSKLQACYAEIKQDFSGRFNVHIISLAPENSAEPLTPEISMKYVIKQVISEIEHLLNG
jgi:thymidylate kinase